MRSWIRTGLLLLSFGSATGCADWITDIPAYATVDVTATRLSGEPVPGAPLTLYVGGRPMGFAVTGRDGSHRFGYLPRNVYGVYADPPEGYVRPEDILGGTTTAIVDGIDVPEGGHGVAEFTYLKVGPGSVEARLTNAEGAVLNGVPASLYNAEGIVAQGTTDGNGTVIFDPAPFGLWGISFEVPGEYLDQDEPGLFLDGILVEEGTRAEVALTARRCAGTITVSVRDRDGDPVAGLAALLFDDQGGGAPDVTGDDGMLAFSDVVCGNYGVRILALSSWLGGDVRGVSFIDGLRVRRGTDLEAAFTVPGCQGEIAARVLDQSGQPVAGATLTVYDATMDVATRASDSQGGRVFNGLVCGQYGVRVLPPSGYSVAPGRGSSFFDGLVVPDRGQVQVTFQLSGA